MPGHSCNIWTPPALRWVCRGHGLLPGTGAETSHNESLAHTKWDCTYHIVQIPKCRRKVPYGEAGTEVRDILRRLVGAKGGAELLEGAVARDHTRMCPGIAPRHSVAKVIDHLKGKSAPMLFDHHPEWRAKTGRDRTFWARGYYVSKGAERDVHKEVRA